METTTTRNALIGVAVLALLLVGGYFLFFTPDANPVPSDNSQNQDASAQVRNAVAQFGLKLKNVSLLTPGEQLKNAIRENYAAYVTPELLDAWLNDPTSAPGRQTSSPWPDRIEITDTQKDSDTKYTVKGNIIEATNDNNNVHSVPVTITVENRNNTWLISSWSAQTSQPPSSDNKSTSDLISVTSPTKNQLVKSPLTITGKARGNWYFEASFPVKLLDSTGKVIAQAPAQAQGEWMTTDFFPFKATLTFTQPSTATGTLVLEKDNPSGLPQNADELRIPVKFK